MARIRSGRQHHERNVAELLPEMTRERWTVEARHLDVEDDHRRERTRVDRELRLGAVARGDDVVAVVDEDLALGFEDVGIVVNDQYRARRLLHGH